MKMRTTNRQGRHLATVRILGLLVEHGVDTPAGFENLEPGRLTPSTFKRRLPRLGYDHARMIRQPPAVRFQAKDANPLWHFDMGPSDLKQLKTPPWIDPDRRRARLMGVAHTLRHTFALGYLRDNPGKLVEFASLLGNESLDPTAINARPSCDDLAADLERSHLNVDG